VRKYKRLIEKREGEAKSLRKQELKKRLRTKLMFAQVARGPRRGITRWKREEIVLKADAVEVIRKGEKEDQIVVDSGTTLHMHRDKDAFESITNISLSIRGVGGVGRGYKGILKQNRIGVGVPAVWYEDLPVRMLISTEGLKRDNWETHFLVAGDCITNRLTQAVLPISKGPTGLPVLQDLFETEGDAFVCTPVAEVDLEESQTFNAESLPKSVRKALTETITDAQKRSRERNRKQRVTKLVEHRRMCHFHEENKNVTCHDCLLNKGKHAGHYKKRPDKYATKQPLLLFSTDFFGKVEPTSYRGSKWGMLYICDECGYAHGKPLAKKSEAPEALEEFVKEIRRKCGADLFTGKNGEPDEIIIAGIRSDNEPTLRSQAWRDTCERMNIDESHSVPYNPEMQGKIERLVQTIKSSLRTTTANTDPRCWDYAFEHIIKVWNLRKRRHSSKAHCCSPEDTLTEMSKNPLRKKMDVSASKLKYLRRYGCLAYFKPYQVKKDHETDMGTALQPRRKRGMHLGFSHKNSAWLIGTYSDGELHVYETRSVTFCEEILVRNIQELNKPVPSIFEQLLDHSGVVAGESAAVGTVRNPVAGAGAQDGLQGLDEIKWETPEASDNDQISGSPCRSVPIEEPETEKSKKSKGEDKDPTRSTGKDPGATMDIDPGESKVSILRL